MGSTGIVPSEQDSKKLALKENFYRQQARSAPSKGATTPAKPKGPSIQKDPALIDPLNHWKRRRVTVTFWSGRRLEGVLQAVSRYSLEILTDQGVHIAYKGAIESVVLAEGR